MTHYNPERAGLAKPACGPPRRIGGDPHALYRCSTDWSQVDCGLCLRKRPREASNDGRRKRTTD